MEKYSDLVSQGEKSTFVLQMILPPLHLIRPYLICLFQDRGVKEDELQSILNYLLTIHEVHGSIPAEVK